MVCVGKGHLDTRKRRGQLACAINGSAFALAPQNSLADAYQAKKEVRRALVSSARIFLGNTDVSLEVTFGDYGDRL